MNKRTSQRMLSELHQLSNRIDRLDIFMVSDAYPKLPKEERILMNEQVNYMKAYYHTLLERLKMHRKEIFTVGKPINEDSIK